MAAGGHVYLAKEKRVEIKTEMKKTFDAWNLHEPACRFRFTAPWDFPGGMASKDAADLSSAGLPSCLKVSNVTYRKCVAQFGAEIFRSRPCSSVFIPFFWGLLTSVDRIRFEAVL